MQAAPFPISEKSRIATLRLLNILDTEPEERFDRLTRMAKKLFSVPIAQVTLVDSERQWFKSSVGVEALETPRENLAEARTQFEKFMSNQYPVLQSIGAI